MVRLTQVLLPLLLVLVAAPVAFTQTTDLKPRPGPAAPAPTARKNQPQGTPSRGRLTARVAVGERAPDFQLEKLDGTPVRLSSLRGNWVLLYFVERRDSLTTLEPVARALDSIGVRTVAVCYDKSSAISRVLREHPPSFLPLADPTGEIVALYGLLDSERDQSQPGFVLITPRGDVRLALLGHDLPSDDASRLVTFAVRGV